MKEKEIRIGKYKTKKVGKKVIQNSKLYIFVSAEKTLRIECPTFLVCLICQDLIGNQRLVPIPGSKDRWCPEQIPGKYFSSYFWIGLLGYGILGGFIPIPGSKNKKDKCLSNWIKVDKWDYLKNRNISKIPHRNLFFLFV